jgi:RND family efflux transporter, MFP subunit
MSIARPSARAAIIALAAIAALAISACSKPKQEASRPPRAVEAIEASLRPFALESEYAARILPSSQVNVTPKVGGRVQEVQVRVGDFVQKGQALLTIESADYDAQLKQAKAALQSAQAQLTRSNDTGQESQVLQAQSSADQARIALDETQKAYDKTKRLFDGGVVSKQQMDEVEAKLKASRIQLDAAERALVIVRDKSGKQAGDVLSGQVDAAQAQADLAQRQLDATTIRSPLTGHVSYCDAEPGALVGSQSLLFIVIDDSSVLAEAGLTDRSIGFVRKGMGLKVSIPALGAKAERAGVVDRVSPATDMRTQLYSVRVAIPNGDGRIRPGMLARIRFPIEERRRVLLVPERATFSDSGLDYVVVSQGGVAKRRQVTLGESDGSSIEVAAGLEPGDIVVVAGQEFVSEGDPINATIVPATKE